MVTILISEFILNDWQDGIYIKLCQSQYDIARPSLTYDQDITLKSAMNISYRILHEEDLRILSSWIEMSWMRRMDVIRTIRIHLFNCQPGDRKRINRYS